MHPNPHLSSYLARELTLDRIEGARRGRSLRRRRGAR